MKCYMLWYGGSSYAQPEVERDTEAFDSLKELAAAFDRRTFDSYYPCVSDCEPEDGGPEGWIFFYDPREEGGGDLYPDRLIRFGPRGGIRIERC